MVKAGRRGDGAPFAHVRHEYAFDESVSSEGMWDCFCIEPMEDGSTIACENFSPSYGLSSSLDRAVWTALTGSVVASNVQAGTKVYLRGDTSTLGSTSSGPGCRFYADKAFKASGSALSLYSPELEPKELTNGYDLRSFFNSKEISECSVDFGPVRNAYYMFAHCSSLSRLPEGFSCPNVTNASRMFYGCSSLSSLPDGFSAPNATDASHMFYDCTSLSSLPEGFNIPNVTYANNMFRSCSSLSSLPAGFSAPNVTDASHMFRSCSSLSSLPAGFSAQSVTNTEYMFHRCSSLSSLPAGFSVPNVTSTTSMFRGCFSLSVIGNNVKIANGAGATGTDNTSMDKSLVTSIGDNFEWFTNATFKGTWDPSKGIRNVFPNATSVGSGWRVYNHYDGEESAAPSDLDYFYIEPTADGAKITCDNFSSSYGLSSSLDRVTWTALTGSVVAAGVPAGAKVYLRGDTGTLGSTDTYPGCRFYSDKAFKAGGRVLSLYSPTLEQKELTNKYDLRSFFYDKEIRECSVDFGPVRSATLMFSGCRSLSWLPDGFSIPNVTSTVFMFSDCSSLSALPAGFSIQNVTDAVAMFYNCSSLSALPDGFSAPNVTRTSRMFERCSRLSGLPDGFSAPNATVTNSMFEHCSRLSGLPDGFSVPNATDTDCMFCECSNLSRLPDGFSAPNTTNTNRMFYECFKLSAIGNSVKIANGAGATSTDNTGMDKSRITSIGDNFEWFTNVKFSGDWDPSKGIRNVFPNATSVGSGWRVYNHYDGEASGEAPSNLDYFYIEPTEDNATVVCENLDQSYNLSYSLDKSSWTALTGGTVATGVPAGTKVYLRGDTSTLGSTPGGSGCKFYSDKAFKAGGSALSLYSPTLEPKELTNEYDLMRSFFYNKEIRECSVDFGPVRNANNMFAYCSNLSALPEGFSIPNVTSAYMMFFDCSSLSALPAGFSAQNVVCAYDTFWRCSRLSGLPDGFSAPNVTDADNMFADCYSLTTIGSNVKVANGAGATSKDNTHIDKSLITSIGDNFEWFTNATFKGTWDPSKGIRNVFPNATSVGPGWKVYQHYDGE